MKKKSISILLLFVAGSLLAGYVMFVAGKEMYRGRKIEKEIEKLREEAEKVKADNEDLREKIAYLDTDQFRERVAKEKLNLRKDGEKVVEVRPSSIPDKETNSAVQEIIQTQDRDAEQGNYMKWWNLFFKY